MNKEENIMFLLLENESPKEKVIEYCEKKLAPLEDSDKYRGTDYMHTLRVYLENGNDLLHSSQKMYIHRNTMLNRMKKISTLLGVDVNETKERLELSNIFYILDYYKRVS